MPVYQQESQEKISQRITKDVTKVKPGTQREGAPCLLTGIGLWVPENIPNLCGGPCHFKADNRHIDPLLHGLHGLSRVYNCQNNGGEKQGDYAAEEQVAQFHILVHWVLCLREVSTARIFGTGRKE